MSDGLSEATIEDEGNQSDRIPTPPSPPQAAPRKSTRLRAKPKWTTDYVMSQQVITPDWLQRAAYLQNLIDDGTLQDTNLTTRALVSIVHGKM
jgi:hypothetical protein